MGEEGEDDRVIQRPVILSERFIDWHLGFDADTKGFSWLKSGSQLVIVVEPELRSATIRYSENELRRFLKQDEIDFGDLLPGLHLRVSELFE